MNKQKGNKLKGNKLKAKIYEKGYTIKELAKHASLSEQTVTNWCNNRNTKYFDSIYKVCKLLNIDIKDLYE